MESTPHQEIDAALQRLNKSRNIWAALATSERLSLADLMLNTFLETADDWVEAAIKAKGVVGYGAGVAQEWMAGPSVTIRNLRLLCDSMRQILKKGHPVIPGPVKTRPDGQVVAQVFPVGMYDKLFFPNTSAEIWMESGVSADTIHDHMAAAYRTEKERSEVSLVLGAGNVSSIAPMDCFYKFFVEKKLVILKMHPVNAYLGPIFERAFAPMIDAGFLAIVYGGADVGDYLCKHDEVDEIHITGSDKTHDVIVFGPESEGRKARKEPLNTRPISSELGNVSPVIIAPGHWSEADLKYHAENLVSSLINNAGFNCNASRVLVTHAGWDQREALLEKVREQLAALPTRDAYYPGAEDRFKAFREAHPEAQTFGNGGSGKLPWMFITGVDSRNRDDIAFQMEAFCGLFAETTIEAENTDDFLQKAGEFANDTLWGTLNATIIINPQTQKAHAAAMDKLVADLRYGSVSINHWAAISYVLCTTTWGAFPGHDLYDIQSGRDVVHNTLMFDKPQKSVVRGPFKMMPKPAWFHSHKKADQVGKKLTYFEASPSIFKTPGVVIAAMGG